MHVSDMRGRIKKKNEGSLNTWDAMVAETGGCEMEFERIKIGRRKWQAIFLREHIRNEEMRRKAGIQCITGVTKKSRSRCFGHFGEKRR